MKLIWIIIFIIWCIFLAPILFIQIDKSNDNRLYKKYIVKSDCNYKLPNQYFLVKDTIKNVYAIKFMHIDAFEYYLYLERFVTIENYFGMSKDFTEAITFEDSCKAKGFFKMYLEYKSNKDKINNFVVIK